MAEMLTLNIIVSIHFDIYPTHSKYTNLLAVPQKFSKRKYLGKLCAFHEIMLNFTFYSWCHVSIRLSRILFIYIYSGTEGVMEQLHVFWLFFLWEITFEISCLLLQAIKPSKMGLLLKKKYAL